MKIHTYKTDKEMIELVLKNLGLEYECRATNIILVDDGYGKNRKVCSHEEIAFEFDNDGKFERIITY